jgi:TetR/AcrR family transcriptional regulator, transcriptional repressor for nem operon
MTDTKTRLLDAAAEAVQTRGYNAFSFHDLAAAVGIKTASIHYHFPTKGALGRALAQRYRAVFLERLGPPAALPPAEQARRYAALFRETLASGRMCLCGMLGAEADAAPPEIREETAAFFAENRAWLVAALGSGVKADARAEAVIALLEGAMLMARVEGGAERFDRIVGAALADVAGRQ